MSIEDRQQRTVRLVTAVAVVAALLVLLVIASSAWLRLTQSGLGCSEWPACYGATATAATQENAQVAVVRATHRVSASAAGFAIAIAAVLWLAGPRHRRGVTLIVMALLGVTAFLAALGRYTAGTHGPSITLGNMLGGMLLLALACLLAVKVNATSGPPGSARLRRIGLMVWLLVAAQIVAGGLVSAKFAALACASFPDCNGVWWPSDWSWRAFDPFDAFQSSSDDASLRLRLTLHMAHRYGAALAGGAAVVLSVVLWRRGGAWRIHGLGMAALVMLQLLLGVALVMAPPMLGLTVAHDVIAAMLLASVTAVAFSI